MDCNICKYLLVSDLNDPNVPTQIQSDDNACRKCNETWIITVFQNAIERHEFPNFKTQHTNESFKLRELVFKDHPEIRVLGKDEWDLFHFFSFSLRTAYHVNLALICEGGLTIGIWLYENLLERNGRRTYMKDFREGNVSHRLTPLFKEYYGIQYNPDLKPTFEKRIWNWIRGRGH